ncbi:MAG: hypothetical protein HY716_08820 [Planctomycetes bacterium]|nr:hypothetical protein [Planctomycetota bacterium]
MPSTITCDPPAAVNGGRPTVNARSRRMPTTYLVFLWHFHQPSYLDAATGKLVMPWVRLHGVKDYTGMAMLLDEFPAIRCTANFSPCLLDQILAYGEGAQDALLAAVRLPPERLSMEERRYLRRQVFLAHPQNQLGVFPRYADLHAKERAGAEFSVQDWLDVETLHALAWIHPCVFEKDAELDRLRARGRSFTLEDRDRVLVAQLRLMAELLPRWKRLREQGRIELSVSPYYHPILPLLCDFESLRRALPVSSPPPLGRALAPDAEAHVIRARRRGQELFGREPEGCWPSEGSVSPEACELLDAQGFRWFATDEEILARSVGSTQELYRPHPVGDGAILGVFRDRTLSNLIGFTYKTWNPQDAAADFVARLEGLHSAAEDRLVVVALDGENPWEHFPGLGVPFLRALYQRLSAHPRIRTATVGEGIARVAPGARIPRIWSGSWINHDFAVWAGHEEDRRGWELVGRVRELLVKRDRAEANVERAWECLYQAEGSDWFWWFGDDFSSAQDAEFDALFRRHVGNACRLAGVDRPEALAHPVKRRRRDSLVRMPRSTLEVVIDGRRSDYFEWIGAGHYDLAREYGALGGEIAYLSEAWFGCDGSRLLIRLDFRAGVDPGEALKGVEVRLVTVHPAANALRIHPPEPGVESALEEIFEAACPLAPLGAGAGTDVEFYLLFRTGSEPAARLPALASLHVKAPAEDHHKINWQV